LFLLFLPQVHEGVSTAYTYSAHGVGSSSSSSSCAVDIGLSVALEWRAELPPSHERHA
jgi:hypothetical protein